MANNAKYSLLISHASIKFYGSPAEIRSERDLTFSMTNSGRIIYALIPARSGSKGIKDKNIIDVLGKPMMAHSILQAIKSRYIDEVYISTDSEKYAEIAMRYGAKAPFLRPSDISGDLSTDYEVFEHFVGWIKEAGIRRPDILVQLRPTYPTRKVKDLDHSIEIFLEHFEEADSLRSVIEAPETPYKMWKEDGAFLAPLLSVPGMKEPYNAPRQSLPRVYWQNACIDMVKTDCIENKKSMTGDRILRFEMSSSEVHDIDKLDDLKKIEEK